MKRWHKLAGMALAAMMAWPFVDIWAGRDECREEIIVATFYRPPFQQPEFVYSRFYNKFTIREIKQPMSAFLVTNMGSIEEIPVELIPDITQQSTITYSRRKGLIWRTRWEFTDVNIAVWKFWFDVSKLPYNPMRIMPQGSYGLTH